jgi:hypothetical protein
LEYIALRAKFLEPAEMNYFVQYGVRAHISTSTSIFSWYNCPPDGQFGELPCFGRPGPSERSSMIVTLGTASFVVPALALPFLPPSDMPTNHFMLLRWIHFVAGICWVGLLYFFNLVNVPFLEEMDATTKSKVEKI